MDRLVSLANSVVECARNAQISLGLGLTTQAYEQEFCYQMQQAGIHFELRKTLPCCYEGCSISEHQVDILVEQQLVIGITNAEKINLDHEAKVVRYLKFGHYPLAMLLNFNKVKLRNGVRKFYSWSD